MSPDAAHPVSMHPDDWSGGAGRTAPRRYRSPGHALHHLVELLRLGPCLLRVYALRTVSPAFRERIMIITAISNDCST